MKAQNCVHLHARVVVPKPEFSVVDQRKIAFTFKNNQFLKKWELQRFLHVNIVHAQR